MFNLIEFLAILLEFLFKFAQLFVHLRFIFYFMYFVYHLINSFLFLQSCQKALFNMLESQLLVRFNDDFDHKNI